jgi:N4-gp56 family major capsid protein
MPGFYGNNNTATATPANFVPEYWSGKLLARFYESTVLPRIINTDYEGEIKDSGSTVRIRRTPKVTITDHKPAGTPGYNPATDDIVYEELDAEEIQMDIDQAKRFAFKVDDVLKAQADISIVGEAMKDAAQGMKIVVERETFSYMHSGVHAANVIGSDAAPIEVNAENILDYLMLMGQRLDEANIPESGRFVIIPPWIATKMKTSELRMANLTGDSTSPLRNGLVGGIDRFEVYQSNLLPKVGASSAVTAIIGGTKAFASFATQVTKTETVRLQTQFGDGVRGMQVYGRKVVQPTAGLCLYAIPKAA